MPRRWRASGNCPYCDLTSAACSAVLWDQARKTSDGRSRRRKALRRPSSGSMKSMKPLAGSQRDPPEATVRQPRAVFRHVVDLALGKDGSRLRNRDRQRHQQSATGTAAKRASRRLSFSLIFPRPKSVTEVFRIHLQKRGRDPGKFEMPLIRRERRLQRGGNRGGDHLGPVRCLQPTARLDHQHCLWRTRRDGPFVEDNERGAESVADLGGRTHRPASGTIGKTTEESRRKIEL